MNYRIGQRIKLMEPTWENSQANVKLIVFDVYTIEKFSPNNDFCTIKEGYHNNSGGWWYELKNFKPIFNINNNIRIL